MQKQATPKTNNINKKWKMSLHMTKVCWYERQRGRGTNDKQNELKTFWDLVEKIKKSFDVSTQNKL